MRTDEYVNTTGQPLCGNLEGPHDMFIERLGRTKEENSGVLTYRCPCGCGNLCQIPVLEGEKKEHSWRVDVDNQNRITLHPSVNHLKGCKSHYFIRENKVIWC